MKVVKILPIGDVITSSVHILNCMKVFIHFRFVSLDR